MNSDVTTLIRWLNGTRRPPGRPGGVIPQYLEPVYDRISAARQLQKYLPTTNLPLRLLLDDPNPEVAGLATDILNNRAIQYYELEAL